MDSLESVEPPVSLDPPELAVALDLLEMTELRYAVDYPGNPGNPVSPGRV